MTLVVSKKRLVYPELIQILDDFHKQKPTEKSDYRPKLSLGIFRMERFFYFIILSDTVDADGGDSVITTSR